MTQVIERTDFGPASRVAGVGDSAAVAELRARGATLAGQLAWPDSHEERPWKYYDASAIGITPATPLSKLRVEFAGPGVATKLADGAPQGFGTVVRPETDRITALHYAFLGEGAMVNVPANAEPAEPVRINWSVSGAGFASPHTSIVTGANSRVTVIEDFTSNEDDTVVLPVAEIVPGRALKCATT